MEGQKRAGVLYMIVGISALSCMDALGKRIAPHYSVFQMLAIRSTVALALIVAFLGARKRLGTLRTAQLGGHAARAFCGLVAFVCFYASLRHLPLADAVAIAFASPFLITALGRFVLKENVTPRQWLAIAVGFLGMLVIVRPGASGFHPAALLVVVCSLAYASMMILTRWMTRPHRPADPNLTFVFYMLAGQAAVGWLVAAASWRTPDPPALLEMAGMGVLGIIGNYGLAEAFRVAPVATVAPFEYTGLIWAVVLGALVFGDVPAPSFWIGAAVIVWAGLVAVRSS